MQGEGLAGSHGCSDSSDVLYRKLKPGPGREAAEVAAHQRARIHSATLELVAANGYDAVTVRDLARAAGVSTRSFYKHYPSKEQCFLRVHRLVVQRVLRVFETSRKRAAGEETQRAIEAVVGALVSEPKAAHLLCVDAYAAGPAALKQADWARRSIEMAIEDGLGDSPEAIGPSLAAEAIVAGIYGAARRCLLDGQTPPYSHLRDALTPWLNACCEDFSRLDELARVPVRRDLELSAPPASVREPRWDVTSSNGDVTALLSAAAKLATTEDYESLTLPRLIQVAGVSRRSFHANFSSTEECFLMALESKAVDAIACVREASEGGSTPEQDVYRAVVALCDQVASHASLASLCFDASVVPGISKMISQQVLIDNLTYLITERLTTERQVNQLTVQVAVGAVWDVIQNHVSMDRTGELLRKAPTLTFLLLAPNVGSLEAVKAVDQKHALTT
jgi:AcrR family transcriptional regulator